MKVSKKILMLFLVTMAISRSYAVSLVDGDTTEYFQVPWKLYIDNNISASLVYKQPSYSDGYYNVYYMSGSAENNMTLSTTVFGCSVNIPLDYNFSGIVLSEGSSGGIYSSTYRSWQKIDIVDGTNVPGAYIVQRDNDDELWFTCGGTKYQYRLDNAGFGRNARKAFLHLYDENGDPVNNAVLPAGSYQQTCKNYTYNSDTGKLEADCYKQYGYTNHSTLNYRNMCLHGSTVFNNSGVLTCDSPAPVGSYQQSCLDAIVDPSAGSLIASCADYRGYYLATSLPNFKQCKYGIENDGGNLRCSQQPISAMSPSTKTTPNLSGSKITPAQLHVQSVKPW